MLEHAALSYDISYAFGPDDCVLPRMSATTPEADSAGSRVGLCVPSSLRIYFKANDRLVSFRSTMRTLPKAPRPTTRSSRKWLRFTVGGRQVVSRICARCDCAQARGPKQSTRGRWGDRHLLRQTRRACPGCYPLERPPWSRTRKAMVELWSNSRHFSRFVVPVS
jgi:hypothetical protein